HSCVPRSLVVRLGVTEVHGRTWDIQSGQQVNLTPARSSTKDVRELGSEAPLGEDRAQLVLLCAAYHVSWLRRHYTQEVQDTRYQRSLRDLLRAHGRAGQHKGIEFP